MCRYETTKAGDAVKALKASLKPQATVCRDGKWQSIDAALLVPGDLALLGSGSHIPADCRVSPGHHPASSRPCHVSQRTLSNTVAVLTLRRVSCHLRGLFNGVPHLSGTWHRSGGVMSFTDAGDAVLVVSPLRRWVADR